MSGSGKYFVEVVDRESRETLSRVVETPFGEYKAAAVALLGVRSVYPDLRYGRISVRHWEPGDIDDPGRTLVDPWRDAWTDGETTPSAEA